MKTLFLTINMKKGWKSPDSSINAIGGLCHATTITLNFKLLWFPNQASFCVKNLKTNTNLDTHMPDEDKNFRCPLFLDFRIWCCHVKIRMKFGNNTRCHWLKGRVLPEYRARSWAKAVTSSANLYFVYPFFVSWKWNFGISEPASSNRRTK